jgi:hypothetical protein
MSVIILLIADSFSDMNDASAELSVRSVTYWIGMVAWARCAELGPCAITSDVAATEAVVAKEKEIARLRMKERENENNVILPPNRTTIARVDFPRPSPAFPVFFLEIRP